MIKTKINKRKRKPRDHPQPSKVPKTGVIDIFTIQHLRETSLK